MIFTRRLRIIAEILHARPYIGSRSALNRHAGGRRCRGAYRQGTAAMSQPASHSSTHSAVIHWLREPHMPGRTVWPALKAHWAGIAIIGLLLLGAVAIRLVRVAAANPAVAQALSRAARLLGFSGM